MAKHSLARANVPLLVGLTLLSRGKVRDTYELPGGELLLQVATDAISIFDFVLNALVPEKGIILTAMSVFWFKLLESNGIKTHLVAYGADIDQYLPENLRNNPDLQSRALVVKKLPMVDDVEFIVRAYLTGSGLKAYNESKMICGHKLPDGLQDGDRLASLIDTPSTKSTTGHDVHTSAEDIRTKYPEQTNLAFRVFQIAYEYALERGIVIADTKFEFGKNGTLADEVLTPDSSRYWLLADWKLSRKPNTGRKAPPSYDKQRVRDYGKGKGIDKLNPEVPQDIERAHSLVVPGEIIAETTDIYRYIFWRLIGMTIEQFRRKVMRVIVPERPAKKVLIICGSETDVPEVVGVCDSFSLSTKMKISVDVMSCHRNPSHVMRFVENCLTKTIICVGGKALALPGIVDAWAYYFDRKIRVAGVALGEPGSNALLAAQLSIEELPGQPVIINEMAGHAYTGSSGLEELLGRIEHGELPPAKPRTIKPVRTMVWANC